MSMYTYMTCWGWRSEFVTRAVHLMDHAAHALNTLHHGRQIKGVDGVVARREGALCHNLFKIADTLAKRLHLRAIASIERARGRRV